MDLSLSRNAVLQTSHETHKLVTVDTKIVCNLPLKQWQWVRYVNSLKS